MSDVPVSPAYVLDDGLALITLDDGKANAISHDVLDRMDAALDQALADDARAIVIAGREGRFSAGFNLAEMTSGTEAMQALVKRGAEFFLKLYGYPLPTIAACTGHALAAGAILLLATDQDRAQRGRHRSSVPRRWRPHLRPGGGDQRLDRQRTIDHVVATLDADIASLTGPAA